MEELGVKWVFGRCLVGYWEGLVVLPGFDFANDVFFLCLLGFPRLSSMGVTWLISQSSHASLEWLVYNLRSKNITRFYFSDDF